MNYIELINQFWQCNNEIPIGCNATALYFYLVKVCNSLGWKETFKHSDRYIALQLGISINTVRLAKNKLKQLGLIDFKSPEKASKGLDGSTKYSILTVSYFDTDSDTAVDTVVDTAVDTVVDTVVDMDSDTRTKHKHKHKQENNKRKFDLSFVDEEYKETFNGWLDYKKGKGQTYKTQRSLQICYNKLLKDSNNNSKTAIEIIEFAIANNYAGFFPLKETSVDKTHTHPAREHQQEEKKFLGRLNKKIS